MRKIISFFKKILRKNDEAYIDEVTEKILYMIENKNELFQ